MVVVLSNGAPVLMPWHPHVAAILESHLGARRVAGRHEDAVGGSVLVSVTVENTGDRPTSEVVQVYSRDMTGVVLRPRRELAGFAKVHLEPGERRRVDILVDASSFAFWDVRVADCQTPAGAFELELARSSDWIEAALPVFVIGNVTDSAEPADTPAISRTDADSSAGSGGPSRRRNRRDPSPGIPRSATSPPPSSAGPSVSLCDV